MSRDLARTLALGYLRTWADLPTPDRMMFCERLWTLASDAEADHFDRKSCRTALRYINRATAMGVL